MELNPYTRWNIYLATALQLEMKAYVWTMYPLIWYILFHYSCRYDMVGPGYSPKASERRLLYVIPRHVLLCYVTHDT